MADGMLRNGVADGMASDVVVVVPPLLLHAAVDSQQMRCLYRIRSQLS